jgi:hypothetical protein
VSKLKRLKRGRKEFSEYLLLIDLLYYIIDPFGITYF